MHKPITRSWVLLSLTVMGWLLVCAWMFKEAGFWSVNSALDQNKESIVAVVDIPGATSELATEEDVPRLKLINDNASEPVAEQPSDLRVVSKPVVVAVDVSSFDALNLAEELVLDSGSNEQYSASSASIEERNELSNPAERNQNVERDDEDVAGLVAEDSMVEGSVAEDLEVIEGSGTDAASTSTSPAVDPALLAYQRTRRNELSVLRDLSAQIGFTPNKATISEELEKLLDRMFDPLYLYSEVKVAIRVETVESSGAATNNLLSLSRGQAIVAYWVNRGLELDRFSIFIDSGDGLSFGTHRVRVLPVGINQ